jgi:opacity protein-like surface antigen
VAKCSALLALIVLFLASGASAQVPTSGNIFFGYSHNSADSNGGPRFGLNGWDGSLEGKVAPWVGIVADLSGAYGSGDSLHTVVFGPRLSVPVGRITPFAHALVGVSHISGHSTSDTSFGDALGGGLDYQFLDRIGWRFQIDDLQTRFFSRTQNDFRFSTGIVLHF